ncbi:MAG: 16S rRNA (uracil(1498)-N(3))-methyltransferase [Alistipes sp.]
MQLFYAPDFTSPIYTLTEEESKHCIRVLRLGCGDAIYITDGRGNLFCCEITEDHPKHCTVRVMSVETEFEKLPYRLVMAVAPTKNSERFEWFLEKATEMGITTVIPLETEHSERRTLKPERALKVITAALKQSLKAYHPDLQPLTPLRELLSAPFEGRRFIAHCDPAHSATGKQYLASALHKGEDAQILIGPEGDFSPAEIEAALAAGYEEISLGTQRLRTETAAVVAVTMVSVVQNME